jgi:transcriptional regulator with XRE-family HTH domain
MNEKTAAIPSPNSPSSDSTVAPEDGSHSHEQRRRELADFLRTRREKLKPEQVGITQITRRRTPGLRREEVAELAGVGTTWYTWLEQARDIQPSSEVLRRLGQALHLNPAEMRHMFSLAGKAFAHVVEPGSEILSKSLKNVVDRAFGVPALVLGHRWDVLYMNREAEEFVPSLAALPVNERNWVTYIFLTDAIVRVNRWEDHARRLVAEFRASLGDSLDSTWVSEIVDKLKNESADFAKWWREHDVKDRHPVLVETKHATRGRITMERTVLRTLEEPELMVLIFTPVESQTSSIEMEGASALATGTPPGDS